jgi:transaldolase
VADHGRLRGATATEGYDAARAVLDELEAIGVPYDDVIEVLETEAVEKFETSWQQLADQVGAELAKKRA